MINLVKRDTPTSLSNLQHQTANASTNTPTYETSCLPPFLTSPITSKSASSELAILSNPTKNISSSSTSLTGGNPTNKLNKLPSSPNQSDASPFNFNVRSETNQEITPVIEKKPLTVCYFQILFFLHLSFFYFK